MPDLIVDNPVVDVQPTPVDVTPTPEAAPAVIDPATATSAQRREYLSGLMNQADTDPVPQGASPSQR